MREGDTINVYKYLLSMKILRSWKVHCDMKRDDGEKLKIKKKIQATLREIFGNYLEKLIISILADILKTLLDIALRKSI